MTEFPQPDITAVSLPFWDGLKAGKLLFQTCEKGHSWMPAREFCPHCLSPDVSFKQASGKARLVSWVIYRTALHDAFKDRIPYNVSLVELEEGPRMITNVLCDLSNLRADMDVTLAIQEEGDLSVARFRPGVAVGSAADPKREMS
jgi:uncharacterized OB-fold protein